MMLSNNGIRFFMALAVFLAAANSHAQNAENQTAENASPTVNLNMEALSWDDSMQFTISLDQPSGSVLQLVEAIRENIPKLNIVVTETASSYRLPEIKLAEVPIRGALSLVSTLTDNAVEVNFQSQNEGSEANLVLISSQEGYSPDRNLTVRVLNVKRLLQEADRDALLSALDEGYRMMGNETNQVEIKIHEATGLLFVKGTSSQLVMAESIVQEIERGLVAAPNTNPYGQPPIIESQQLPVEQNK